MSPFAIVATLVGLGLGGAYLYERSREKKAAETPPKSCPTEAQMTALLADLVAGKLSKDKALDLATAMENAGCIAQAIALRAGTGKLGEGKILEGGAFDPFARDPVKRKLGGVADKIPGTDIFPLDTSAGHVGCMKHPMMKRAVR